MLIFIQDGKSPLVITADGLFDDGVIKFRLNQDSIKNALANHPDGGNRLRLHMWSHDHRKFVQCPRNDTQNLLPGEGRLYRKVGVTNLVNFATYESRVSPPNSRTIPSLNSYAAATFMRYSSPRPSSPSSSVAEAVSDAPTAVTPSLRPKRAHSPAVGMYRKRRKASQVQDSHANGELDDSDVIELTDSDDDAVPYSSGAGSSRSLTRSEVIILSDSD